MTNLHQHSVLIVDDHPENSEILFELLLNNGFRVCVAESGASALTQVQQALPDLILLDVMMPEINGFETCRRLKQDPITQDIPVLFLSGLDEEFNKMQAFAVGGADYITKPFQLAEVLVRVQHQLALQKAKVETAVIKAELEDLVQQRTAQLTAANHALEQEIAERKQAEQRYRHGALHDALTNLPNRTCLMEHLEQALRRFKRGPDYLFAVLFIDLDRFKVVNDSLGHQAGDQLLVTIADQLGSVVRASDTVARIGGDEFVILLDPIKHVNNAIRVAERIAQELQSPFVLGGQQVFATASIGIALSSINYDQGADLLRDADIAMYRAKAKGKARYEVFNAEMYTQALARLQLENDLRHALEGQEVELYYQPIVEVSSERVRGFEALCRWQHPVHGWISPAEFIPIAEETGLIVPLGEWVLRQACEQMSVWQTEVSMATPLTISVNLSVRQLRDPNFLAKLDQILHQTGLKGEHLHLELTESMLMENVEDLIDLLSLIQARDIQLSIDDFGTGYSSLSYLHRLPINTLKIDRSFVNRIGQQGEKQEIVETIINLAHQIDMTVISEGVETLEQLNYLKSLSCQEAQGYLFSKPLPATGATDLVKGSNLGLQKCYSH